jgi:hypothetical protein
MLPEIALAVSDATDCVQSRFLRGLPDLSRPHRLVPGDPIEDGGVHRFHHRHAHRVQNEQVTFGATGLESCATSCIFKPGHQVHAIHRDCLLYANLSKSVPSE